MSSVSTIGSLIAEPEPEPKRTRVSANMDPEIRAIHNILRTLEPLTPRARERCMTYVCDKIHEDSRGQSDPGLENIIR
ncbi:hypothetical protein [Singulisphaera sp. PoT]|uniref:hypothetical protein n=1 Tax=Singulisphaera sp. PoT TaxID=3411797 RepID=UPI003BF465ED